MIRTSMLAGLFLSAVLAGCASDSGSDDVVVPPIDTAVDLTLGGCSEQFGVFPIPMEATAWLPEGFKAVPFDDAGLFATEYIVAYNCAAASTAGEGESVAEMSGGIVVTPPEEFVSESIGLYGVPYGIFTTSEANAALYAKWNIGGQHADVVLTTLADTPAAAIGTARGSVEGFAVRTATNAVGPAESSAAGGIRLFGLDENYTLLNAVDVAWTEAPFRMGTAVAGAEYEDPAGYVGSLMGIMPPAGPGLGFIGGNETYGFTYTVIDLETLPGAAGEASARADWMRI